MEPGLREKTNIAGNQFGFRPGKSTIRTDLSLRMLQAKYREKNKELHVVFVDHEKVFGPGSKDGGAYERKESRCHGLSLYPV